MGKNRLEAFSDGVIAILMTIMVLDLKVPEGMHLAPNLNHHATGFAGSAGALAILAAWSLLYVRLRASFPLVSIVTQRQSMRYRRPIQGTFAARATLAHVAEWPRFLRLLARRAGKNQRRPDARLCRAGSRRFHR
jgi:thioesterase domain-containing protein